jgi:hypothetical protein
LSDKSDKLLEVTGVAYRGDSPREARHEPEASLAPDAGLDRASNDASGLDDGREELYDLASDPDEQRNLAAEQPRLVASLRARLETEVDLTSTAALSEQNQLREDPEMNRLLESLGYLEEDDPKLSNKGLRAAERTCDD